MTSASGGTSCGPMDRGSRFRGLDDYTEYPEIQTKKKRLHNNNNECIDPKTGFAVTEKLYAEFYIVERSEENKSFEQVSPFFIEKALTSHIGPHHETKRLRNGTLLVKCKNDKQAKLLLNFNNTLFGNTFKVKVTEHASLNTVQGLIYCWDSKYLSEEEIIEGLAEQKVIAVRKIKRKVGANLVDTALCILTFKRSQLPISIKFGFHSVLVKPYIPNPLRCMNCFRFGHTRKNCKKDRICAMCSESFHDPDICVSGSRCVNCKGAHTNWSKECPHFVREMGIQTIKVQEKLSYIEAKKKYDSFPHAPQMRFTANTNKQQSYTQVLKSRTETNEKQIISNSDTQSNTITNPTKFSNTTKCTPTDQNNDKQASLSSNLDLMLPTYIHAEQTHQTFTHHQKTTNNPPPTEPDEKRPEKINYQEKIQHLSRNVQKPLSLSQKPRTNRSKSREVDAMQCDYDNTIPS